MREEKRIQYVDYYKYIGITLMIMGHVGLGEAFDKYIHAFHMPMFFVASGFCFSSGREFHAFLRRKIQSILIPYFAFSIITFFALRSINGISISAMQNVLWVNNLNTPIAGVWFLTALFWANLLYFFIDKLDSAHIKWWISVLCFLVGISVEKTIGYTLPWSLTPGMVGVLYIHVGRCASLDKLCEKYISSKYILFFFILLSILIFVNGHVNLRTGEYANYGLFYFNSCSMSVLLLYIAAKQQYPGRLYNLACRIGRYSISYLCLNQIAIRYSRELVNRVLGQNDGIEKVLILFISFAAMFCATEIIRATRLSVLIGSGK